MLIGLVLVASRLAVSGLKADLKADLQAKYDAMGKAFAKRDASTFEKVLAPKYVLLVKGRPPETRDQILRDFQGQMKAMHDSSWTRSIKSFAMVGPDAVVMVSGHFSGHFAGHGGRNSKFELLSLSKDTWKKSGSDWRLTKSELQSMSAKVDGKTQTRP